MATPGSNDNLGKKDRRAAARETARIDREAERRRSRRNKYFLQGGVGLAVIAIAAVVMLVIVNQPKPVALSSNAAGPLNAASDGILLSGPDLAAVTTPATKAGGVPVATKQDLSKLNIVTYIDYICPYCNQFEATNAQQIKQLVANGKATLEIHPLANLDNNSQGARYSTRSTNAVACVANYAPNTVFDVNAALFANQPAEGTTGLSDQKLLSVLKGVGASSSDITKCVKSQEFATWVGAATARTRGAKIPNSDLSTPANGLGTPTVIVNGLQYKGGLTNPAEFAAFLKTVPTK